MKKFKYLIMFIVIILVLIPLTACGETNPRKDYKTAKPSSIYNKNIFRLSKSDTGNITNFADLIAKKVFIYNDFSADITYEIAGKTLEDENTGESANYISKENIAKAIDNYNKEIYRDNNYRLYNQDNRILYLDEKNIKNDETGTNIILTVYVTNLSYICSSYKLMSLKDYVEAENPSSLSSKVYQFFNIKGTRASLIGDDAPSGNFKMFVLESSSYFPTIETQFIFEGNIVAYFNKTDKISDTNPKNITIVPPITEQKYIAVMYQISGNQPVNWAIIGPVIGIIIVFLSLLSVKIIQTVKTRKKLKGR